MVTKPNSATSERSAETRQRILDAAPREFAAHGLAGGRTETIATAAGVNKALIYYYFDSKEKLYAAALEMIPQRVRDASMAVFLRDAQPGRTDAAQRPDHFDRILAQQEFQSLMQQEMIRLHKGESAVLPILIKRVFEPLMIMYQAMVREGIASGELINADWMQIPPCPRWGPMSCTSSARRCGGSCCGDDPLSGRGARCAPQGDRGVSGPGNFSGPAARRRTGGARLCRHADA